MMSGTNRAVSSLAALLVFSGAALAQNSGNDRKNNPSAPGSVPSNGFFISPRPVAIPSTPRQNFGGIGTGRAHTDLLSDPARFHTFPTPQTPPMQQVPHHVTDREAAAWWVNHREHGRDHGGDHWRGRWPVVIYNPPYVYSEGSYLGTGGLYVNGDWRSRHWNVNFGLGSPYTGWPYGAPAVAYSPDAGYVYGYGNPFYSGAGAHNFGPYSVPGGYPYGVLPAPAYAPQYAPQPAPQAQPPAQPEAQPPPLSDMDRALSAMSEGHPDTAVNRARAYLKTHADDARAMRVLAVALLETKDFDDASAMFRRAYATDPGLASEPIDLDQLSLGAADLRALLHGAVLFAHRVKSGSSWLAVAALMQAQGRDALAADMIARAEKEGLEPGIVTPMKAALTH